MFSASREAWREAYPEDGSVHVATQGVAMTLLPPAFQSDRREDKPRCSEGWRAQARGQPYGCLQLPAKCALRMNVDYVPGDIVDTIYPS